MTLSLTLTNEDGRILFIGMGAKVFFMKIDSKIVKTKTLNLISHYKELATF